MRKILGSWSVGGALLCAVAVLAPSSAARAQERVRVSDAQVAVGETSSLRIALENPVHDEIFGIEAWLEFDPTLVEVVSVRSGVVLDTAWGNPLWNVLDGRKLGIAIAGASSVQDPGTLFEVEFRGLKEGQTPVQPFRVLLNEDDLSDLVPGTLRVGAGVSNGVLSWGEVKMEW